MRMLPLLLAMGWVAACGQTETPSTLPVPEAPRIHQANVVDAPGVAPDSPVCDAGDEAFVRRVTPLLLGRHPHALHEVGLLASVANVRGRDELVRALSHSPEFATRWVEVLADLLHVNRAGSRANDDCFGAPLVSPAGAELATHVRDHGPLDAGFDAPWNFSDLLRSTIALDDLRPVLRAHLFTQAGSEIIDADDPNDERAWRRAYSDLFEQTYLNRRMPCLSCHNSDFAVTDALDEADDRHWPVTPGLERALYGESQGQATTSLDTLFRIKGVLALLEVPEGPEFWLFGPGHSPWGLSPGCGQFVLPDAIEPDPLGGDAFLIEAFGPTGSIWDVESLLRDGFAALDDASDFDPRVAPDDGRAALAWMVAQSVSELVWTELTGRALTTPTGFARNRHQRDLLEHLATRLVQSRWSLVELLVTIVTHPYFNAGLPSECAGTDAYSMSPVLDPWVVDHEQVALRGNSAGELVTRLPARVLHGAAAAAMQWVPPQTFFPDDLAEGARLEGQAAFQRDIGVFLRDGETGFRGSNFQEMLAWEEAFGGCRDPFGPDEHTDWIDGLIASGTGFTALDGVIALKDRLLADPTLAEREWALMQALTGFSADTPLTKAEAGLRAVCAALLASPQFVQQGMALPDRLGSAPPVVESPEGSRATRCETIAGWLGDATCDDSAELNL